MNYKQIALKKNLIYVILKRLNNNPKYQVINLETKKVLYYGSNAKKARKIVREF